MFTFAKLMVHEFQIRVLPQIAASTTTIKEYVAREKGIDARTINEVRVLKRSIDARHRQIFVNLSIRVFVNECPADEGYEQVS